MIQRLQSIYLLVLFLSSSYLLYESKSALAATFFSDNYGFALGPLFSFVTLLLFKKRTIQAFFCFVLIVIQVLQIGIYIQKVDFALSLGWTEGVIIFSLFNTILALLARRLILKDEALVRSIDRIR
ncbi:MAG: DUF4293 family protein [Flavobacteriaceae bacterium]